MLLGWVVSLTPRVWWVACGGCRSSYGYGQLTLSNATHLHFLFKGIDGSSGDEFFLVKA